MKIRPVGVFLISLAVSCAMTFLISRPDIAQILPRRLHSLLAAVPLGNATETKRKCSGRPDLNYYKNSVRESMFSAPMPAPPKLIKIEMAKPIKTVIIPQIPILPPSPLADWVYSGTVTSGERKLALLENKKLNEGKYVEAGNSFQLPGSALGAHVDSVEDQVVTITIDGKISQLVKSDTINVIPLDRSAPYLNNGKQPILQTGAYITSRLDLGRSGELAGWMTGLSNPVSTESFYINKKLSADILQAPAALESTSRVILDSCKL